MKEVEGKGEKYCYVLKNVYMKYIEFCSHYINIFILKDNIPQKIESRFTICPNYFTPLNITKRNEIIKVLSIFPHL